MSALWNLEKCFSFHLKSFLFTRKSNFSVLDIRISCHQISKHNKKCILLNNLGSKHSALTKFGQFMSYYKRKDFIKKFYKNCDLKTSPRPICVCKDLSTTSIGICPNQDTDVLIFLFTGGSLKIKKGLELVSRPQFFHFFW